MRTHGTGALLLLTALLAPPLSAQDSARDDIEAAAKRARMGAGLRAGAWLVQDLATPSGVDESASPAFVGAYQKGLDRHLVIESTVGLWRRSLEATTTGPLGGTTTEHVTSYLLPLLTSIKLYPLTGPERPFEPYLAGGVGFALAIDDRETSGGDLNLGVGSGTSLLTGFGFTLGTGAEWRFSNAFGLAGGGRYQWLKFGEEVGGVRTFRGVIVDAGLTYRFQY